VAISQSLVVTNESNPYFQITYKDSENATYNSAQTGKISMRECMDFTTFDFVQDKFFEKLLNEIKPTIEANNAAERN
jgi:hypothetical protein